MSVETNITMDLFWDLAFIHSFQVQTAKMFLLVHLCEIIPRYQIICKGYELKLITMTFKGSHVYTDISTHIREEGHIRG